MTRIIALMALTTLGLPGALVHEPVHGRASTTANSATHRNRDGRRTAGRSYPADPPPAMHAPGQTSAVVTSETADQSASLASTAIPALTGATAYAAPYTHVRLCGVKVVSALRRATGLALLRRIAANPASGVAQRRTWTRGGRSVPAPELSPTR